MKITTLVSIFLVAFAISLASPTHHHDDHGPIHYKFEYGVDDHHTGDKKSHFEHWDGKHVVGEYKLKEADGTTRIVKYKAGPHNGFTAEVKRKGHAKHPAYHIKKHDEHKKEEKKHKEIAGGSSYEGITHFGAYKF